MALSELNAIESAYTTLQQLDHAGRRRALQWLADALADGRAMTVNASASQVAQDGEVSDVAHETRRGPRKTVTAATRPTKQAPRKSTAKTVRKATPPTTTAKRIRRARPDAEKIMAAYEKTGSISGLGAHFKVPAYTAYSWARTLRQQGYEIGRA